MSRQRVLLRADASKSIGFGHFVRSLALANYLKEDYDCYFFTFNPVDLQPSEYQRTEILRVCRYIEISADCYETYDAQFLAELRADDIVVLDNYYFSTEFQKEIRARGCKLVCIDDLHDRHFVADALLTGCPLEISKFSIEPYTLFCSGIEHSFLRPPFLSVGERERRQSAVKKIVLAMGGADPFRLTDKILRILKTLRYNFEISIIAGDTVSVHEDLSEGVKVYQRVNAEAIVRIFSEADLGIFPASTICIEALACSLPAAVGWYVDNQADLYKYGVSHNLFLPLGNLLDYESALIPRIESAVTSNNKIMPSHIDFNKGKQDIINIFRRL